MPKRQSTPLNAKGLLTLVESSKHPSGASEDWQVSHCGYGGEREHRLEIVQSLLNDLGTEHTVMYAAKLATR